jgi:hypothetical protein
MIKHITVLFLLVALLAIVTPSATAVYAGGNGALDASPDSGPVGTVFAFTASGFPANTGLWLYAVEPDGRAVACTDLEQVLPPDSGAGFCDARSASDGRFSFKWDSSHAALGAWTWVVQTANGSYYASYPVHVDGAGETIAGATLSASPSAGRSSTFSGGGFGPNDIVNVWVTFPSNCSGLDEEVLDKGEGVTSLLDINPNASSEGGTQGLRANVYGIYMNGSPNNPSEGGDPKADAGGNISFTLTFASWACTGVYHVSARDLGTGAGAIADFEVTGSAVTATASLAVLNSPNPLSPLIQFVGYGFQPNAVFTCWTTRPDGRVFSTALLESEEGKFTEFASLGGSGKADAGGNISGQMYAEWLDSNPNQDGGGDLYSHSAEPGWWSLTCKTVGGSQLAVASFAIYALPGDP